MKKIFSYLTLLIVTFLLPLNVLAFETKQGENVDLGNSDVINDDLYVFTSSANISEEINGDLLIMSGDAKVRGKISQDLFIGSGQVEISGEIKDDVRIAAGNITISGNIGGDLLATGGNIILDENATVSGKVAVSGGMVTIKGKVKKDLVVNAGNVDISGTIEGNVFASAEQLTLKDKASLKGDLVYSSVQEARIENNQSIQGEIKYTKLEKEAQSTSYGKFGSFFAKRSLANNFITGFLKWLATSLSLFLIGTLVLFLRKDAAEKIYANFKKQPANTLLFGLLILCTIPIVSFILFFTLIGIPLGLIGLILYFIGLYLSALTTAFVAAKHFLPKLNLYLGIFLSILAISAILTILGFIPILGSPLKLVLKLGIYSLNFGTLYFLLKKSHSK
jgi:cytoskeletal protein CcmA (bactofilin family)